MYSAGEEGGRSTFAVVVVTAVVVVVVGDAGRDDESCSNAKAQADSRVCVTPMLSRDGLLGRLEMPLCGVTGIWPLRIALWTRRAVIARRSSRSAGVSTIDSMSCDCFVDGVEEDV